MSGGATRRGRRVAVIMGSRLNPWHTAVHRELQAELELTAFGTTTPRYPLASLGLPLVQLPWENEVGSWPRRKLLNLRWRLGHRRSGYEFTLAPAGRWLDRQQLLHSWELFTAWTWEALESRSRCGQPLLISVWDNLLRDHPQGSRERRCVERALAEASCFLVPTQRSRALLELEGVSAERIVSLAPDVDCRHFQPGEQQPARHQLGWSQEATLAVCVARLVPEKGVATALLALALASRRHPNLELALVGDGPQRAELERLARRLGVGSRVIWCGEQPWAGMPVVYQAADMLLLPSRPAPHWQEQWGQSLLEAQACGRACIASATGGVPEVLDPSCGLLVAAGDHLELAEALLRLSQDRGLREQLGHSGRKRMLERHATPLVAARLAALYRHLEGVA